MSSKVFPKQNSHGSSFPEEDKLSEYIFKDTLKIVRQECDPEYESSEDKEKHIKH